MTMIMTMMMAMMMTMMVLMMVPMVVSVMVTMVIFVMVSMVVPIMVSMVTMMMDVVLFGYFFSICGHVLSAHSDKFRRFRRSIIRFDDCRGDKCQHAKATAKRNML